MISLGPDFGLVYNNNDFCVHIMTVVPSTAKHVVVELQGDF